MNKKFNCKWVGEEVEFNRDNLTDLECEVIIAMRNNDFSDLLESECEFMFPICDEFVSNTGKNENSFGGVISSLVKKGYIECETDKKSYDIDREMVSTTGKFNLLFKGV